MGRDKISAEKKGKTRDELCPSILFLARPCLPLIASQHLVNSVEHSPRGKDTHTGTILPNAREIDNNTN